MRHSALLLLCPLLLAACASLKQLDPATLDCPGLDSAIRATQGQLQDARNTRHTPFQINLGLGGAIGSHGSAGIGVGVPLGTPQPDNERIAKLEQRLAELTLARRQRCGGVQP